MKKFKTNRKLLLNKKKQKLKDFLLQKIIPVISDLLDA